MAAPTHIEGKLVLRVYLLDNSMKTLLVEPTSTVQDVTLTMAEKLGFPNPADDCLSFALHECEDGVNIDRPLPPGLTITSIVDSWPEDGMAKLVYMVKLYTETMLNSEDDKLIYMMYIQAVYNVITSMYPASEEEVVTLAALQVQVKFGKHNAASHKAGFLTSSIEEYVPKAHLDESDNKVEDWEEKVFQKHRVSFTTKPMPSYLTALNKRDYYGSALFVVKQGFTKVMPKRLILAINRKGIVLLKKPTSLVSGDMATLASYSLSEVFRWAYKPGINFYFEIKGPGDRNPVYTFATTEGQAMSDLLTDYAMALLREMGLSPDGTKLEEKEETPASAAFRSGVDKSEPTEAELAAIKKTAEVEARLAKLEKQKADAEAALAKEREAKEEALAAVADAAADDSSEGEIVDEDAEEPTEEASEAEEGEGEDDGEEEELPPNWTKVWDDGNEAYYYFNEETGESSWDLPEA